jgi:hypothetical protein
LGDFFNFLPGLAEFDRIMAGITLSRFFDPDVQEPAGTARHQDAGI